MDSENLEKTNSGNDLVFIRSTSASQSQSRWGLLFEVIRLLLFEIPFIIFTEVIRFFLPAKRKSLEGELVLITGAAGYVGRSLAHKISDKGAKLILWDINKEGIEAVAREIVSKGGQALTYHVNLRDKDEVYRTADKVKQHVGNPTMLINNAGVVGGKNLLDLSDDQINMSFDINILAHFWTCRAFLPGMLANNHGHIVGIASIMGKDGVPGVTDYCASKHAAVGFMQSLRREVNSMGHDGVHFTTVNPYAIDAKLFQGTSIRFPNMPFLKVLKVDDVTDKIMDAIQTNQIVLFIPRSLNITPIIQSIMPMKALDRLQQFLGSDKAMQTFVGRKKHE